MNKKKRFILDAVLWMLLVFVTFLIVNAYPNSDIRNTWLYLWSSWGMLKASQMFGNYICNQEVYVEEFVDGEEED